MKRITLTSDDLVSTDEASEMLGYSKVHLWRLRKAGKLHCYFFGNRPYFSRAEIEKLIVARGTK